MNWYFRLSRLKKQASVTFYIGDGANKISKPKNILDLSFELSRFFYYGSTVDHDTAPLINDITSDGDDFDKFKGTINVYPSVRLVAPQNMSLETYDSLQDSTEEEKLKNGFRKHNNSIEAMMPVIDEWIQLKSAEGYVFEKKMDTSNMTGGPVLRLIVKENPSENYANIPEVHMNNANAASLLRTMGFLPESSGSVHPDDLIAAINEVSKESIQRNIRPEQREYGKDGELSMYSGGIDEGYIDQRLQQLYELADFAKNNNFQEIYWS